MVACKSWNDRPEDKTDFFAGPGYQNPRDLDANNYTLITFNEIVDGPQPDWVFGRQLCMHCIQPACASACPTTAMFKTDLGPVVFDESRCIGCRACMQACPFIIPKYDYESFAPKIHKCTFCADRLEVGLEPACAQVCPTGAITFGDRDDMFVSQAAQVLALFGVFLDVAVRAGVPASLMSFALLFASSYFSTITPQGGSQNIIFVGSNYLTQGELYWLGLLTTGFCLLVFLVVGTPWLLFVAR